MEKLSARTDSVRLTETQSRWLQEWVKETSQDRAVVIRAAVKLLRIMTTELPFDAKVRLIARLADPDPQSFPSDEAEVWAAFAAKVMVSAQSKGKSPKPPTDRK